MDTIQGEPTPVNAPAVKPRRTTRRLYDPIDIQTVQVPTWPDVVPKLSEAEAFKAAQKLLRRFLDERFCQEKHGMSRAAYYRSLGRQAPPPTTRTVKRTLGRNHSWVRGGVVLVNAGQGWRHLVHDLSHYCHWRLRPKDRPHSDNHRHLEKEMIAHVVSNGWLDGKLKPKRRTLSE